MGYRRIFFGRFNDNATIRDAVAFEPQSVVGTVCNEIFARMYQQGWNPILQVHDEVVIEVPDDKIDKAKTAMQECSCIPLYLNEGMDPLIIPIEITVGKNWRDCK